MASGSTRSLSEPAQEAITCCAGTSRSGRVHRLQPRLCLPSSQRGRVWLVKGSGFCEAGLCVSILTGPCALGSEREHKPPRPPPPREFSTVSWTPGAGSERPIPALQSESGFPGAGTLELDSLVSSPAAHGLCDLGQIAQPLCASVSSAVKWDSSSTCPVGWGRELKGGLYT